jgi:hypothetical protein
LKRFDLLRSPIFLLSLALLLLNDFVLKAAFHNWVTGKLSDVSGLTAFTLFCCAIFPKQIRTVGFVTTLMFTFWKSEYSQGLIDFINAFVPFHIGRTIDYTDLLALPAVWLACYFAPTLRLWKMSQLKVVMVAGISLVAFTGTTVINSHIVRKTAEISPSRNSEKNFDTEASLKAIFDGAAERHGMKCSVCDPLSKGRLYVKDESSRGGISLSTNFDSTQSSLFYEVRAFSLGGEPKEKKTVDALQDELQKALRATYPSLEINDTKPPRSKTIQLGIWKKEPFTSYNSEANQDDYAAALEIIDGVATRNGLQRFSKSIYYEGRLFGPTPYDRELVLNIGIADSPLVAVSIDCYSAEKSARQKFLAKEIEQGLQKKFGTSRAAIR